MHKLKSLATGNLVYFLLLLLCPVASFSQELSEAEKEIISYQNTIRLVNKAIEEGRPSDFYLQDNADARVSFSPPVEVINTDGLVVKPAPGIINLGSSNPAPAACSLFDVWDDGRGICNRFFSHVEAERHYDAALATVAEANQGRDACLNELVELKNNEGKEPTPVPSSSPSVKCNRVGDFKDGAGKNLWKAIPDQKASCASTSVIVFQKEFTGSLGANIDILDASGKKIGSAKPKAIGPVMDDGRSVFCTDKRFSGNIFVNYSRAGSLECREVYNASQRED